MIKEWRGKKYFLKYWNFLYSSFFKKKNPIFPPQVQSNFGTYSLILKVRVQYINIGVVKEDEKKEN